MRMNDEPVYRDALGYYDLARRVGHRVLKCTPPYVIGVCGSWGSGKTSFLKMLWAYLGGPFELDGGKYQPLQDAARDDWFSEPLGDFDQLRNGRKVEFVWFDPWQHQFETTPLVALLNEIRRHFSLTRKILTEGGKLANVSIHAALDALTELGKDLKIPIPGAKGILERGREYETEHFSSPLASQRFRDFFEAAIREVTDHGLLVIFIDDLDRCEGEVAYRLLDALKLYVNANNCVYILGLDQNHLERSIAKALSGERDTWPHRPLAREYLSKILQSLFHLPVPRHSSRYVEELLDPNDEDFKRQLENLFGLTQPVGWKQLVDALDRNLPHNPRKIKSFIASWKLYLDALIGPVEGEEKLEWRLTLVLHYLAQFEEPLFRKVEEAPAFYFEQVLRFCRMGSTKHPLFHGLELPYKSGSETDEEGGVGDVESGREKDESKSQPQPRIFWISRLVNDHSNRKKFKVNDEVIYRHLLRTGGKAVEPLRPQPPEEITK
jgi:hypothetical protein